MSKVNYAAIDIGSNAVRLLIKSINPETAEQLFTKELLLRVPLRLGEEVFTQGEIPASKAKNTKSMPIGLVPHRQCGMPQTGKK